MNEQLNQWLERDPDKGTQEELKRLISDNNQEELADRFKSRLEFGTAGLRGKVGCGPNRMNRLVIQETAAGLGHYLLASVEQAKEKGVVIGYDGRLDSRTFASDTASVLTALGIKVYLTDTVAPTPVVAFGISRLGTAAGIVVTASHNPPEYNGFKVYWGNGAQIIPPHDQGIAAEIDRAAQAPLPYLSLEQAHAQQLLVWLSDDYYRDYRETIGQQSLLQADVVADDLVIAYTAMHGVGAPHAEAMLQSAGFSQVYSVAEQREPDGHFPTVNFPNPEEDGAMDLVMQLASKQDADLACANDPDADRFAVAARLAPGEYRMLSGDQVGVLLADYLLQHQCLQQESSNTSRQPLIGNTIVSSGLLEKIAQQYQGTYFKTLTGFKWLTNVAMEKESEQQPFLFAYEEALGYTIGDCVRDKDGLSALVVFAQLAASLKQSGLTVWDRLEQIYRRHGLYVTAQKSLALSPDTPPVGDALRAAPPQMIAGRKVLLTEDYKTSQRYDAEGRVEKIDLPVSDVLIYHLEDQCRVIVRPSGTEPKLKCYYELAATMGEGESFADAQRRAEEQMTMLISEHQHSL